VRPRSQADDVSQARAPDLSWRVPTLIGPLDDTDEQTAIDPVDLAIELLVVRRIDDADEVTAIDPVEPDNEPTALRPPIAPPPIPPALAPRRTRLARGSSHGFGPGLLGHIGKYELRDKLGRGAFGVVFTARDPSLDRDVAIKVLRPTHLTNQEIVQRFLQEARATARIGHPGIVTIHDCGQVETNLGATAFIAMELLTGESLTSRLARLGRLLPEAAAEIARQIASALEMAHRVDVLHRDLKPDNIYLVPDPAIPSGERVKILDFGLAKLGREGHTQLQTVFGTPRYMSPEQCRSATQIDHRSDIYSLGCILFELVTGRLPFDGDVRQLVDRHQRATPPRARSLVPELLPALDQLIAEMLAKDPMQRPQTMGAVQRALQHLVGTSQVLAAEIVVPTATDQFALPPEPLRPTTPFERTEPRQPSEPPVGRDPAVPGPSESSERPVHPLPADGPAPSGVLLVPAGARPPVAGPPTAPSPVARALDPRAMLVWAAMAGLFALLLIAILATV
jgi:serine/threonine protein kinase